MKTSQFVAISSVDAASAAIAFGLERRETTLRHSPFQTISKERNASDQTIRWDTISSGGTSFTALSRPGRNPRRDRRGDRTSHPWSGPAPLPGLNLLNHLSLLDPWYEE